MFLIENKEFHYPFKLHTLQHFIDEGSFYDTVITFLFCQKITTIMEVILS